MRSFVTNVALFSSMQLQYTVDYCIFRHRIMYFTDHETYNLIINKDTICNNIVLVASGGTA